MIPRRIFQTLVQLVLDQGAKKATYYFSEKEVAKLTYFGHRRRNERRQTMTLTVGNPNWDEREFIRKAKKAGESFPIKKVQLRFAKKRK